MKQGPKTETSKTVRGPNLQMISFPVAAELRDVCYDSLHRPHDSRQHPQDSGTGPHSVTLNIAARCHDWLRVQAIRSPPDGPQVINLDTMGPYDGWPAMAEGVNDGVSGTYGSDGKSDYSRTLMMFHVNGQNTSTP